MFVVQSSVWGLKKITFYVTKTKECRGKKKKSLSFPPPWEFQTSIFSSRVQTPFSSWGTQGFLSICLGIYSLNYINLFFNLCFHILFILQQVYYLYSFIKPAPSLIGNILFSLYFLKASLKEMPYYLWSHLLFTLHEIITLLLILFLKIIGPCCL